MKCSRQFVLATASTITLLGLTVSLANACNIPVFRYALEKWASAPHEVVVLTKGQLTADQAKVVDYLRQVSSGENNIANLRVQLVDLNDPGLDEKQKTLYGNADPKSLPQILAKFPTITRVPTPYWQAPLSLENAKTLVESPVRQKVAREIMKGASAVWLLLESGNAAADEKAAQMLTTQLKELEKKLKLPVLTDNPEDQLNSDVALQLQFKLVRVSRTDPKESAFVQMLLHTEKDLLDFEGEPMVFPMFGQGRCLPACIGQGITAENVANDATYLTGPCTCQVKEQNPGFDLLVRAPWESVIANAFVKEKELPPLTGISDFNPKKEVNSNTKTETATDPNSTKTDPEVQTATDPKTPMPTVEEDTSDEKSSVPTSSAGGMQNPLLRNSLLALALAGSIVVIMFLFLRKPANTTV